MSDLFTNLAGISQNAASVVQTQPVPRFAPSKSLPTATNFSLPIRAQSHQQFVASPLPFLRLPEPLMPQEDGEFASSSLLFPSQERIVAELSTDQEGREEFLRSGIPSDNRQSILGNPPEFQFPASFEMRSNATSQRAVSVRSSSVLASARREPIDEDSAPPDILSISASAPVETSSNSSTSIASISANGSDASPQNEPVVSPQPDAKWQAGERLEQAFVPRSDLDSREAFLVDPQDTSERQSRISDGAVSWTKTDIQPISSVVQTKSPTEPVAVEPSPNLPANPRHTSFRSSLVASQTPQQSNVTTERNGDASSLPISILATPATASRDSNSQPIELLAPAEIGQGTHEPALTTGAEENGARFHRAEQVKNLPYATSSMAISEPVLSTPTEQVIQQLESPTQTLDRKEGQTISIQPKAVPIGHFAQKVDESNSESFRSDRATQSTPWQEPSSITVGKESLPLVPFFDSPTAQTTAISNEFPSRLGRQAGSRQMNHGDAMTDAEAAAVPTPIQVTMARQKRSSAVTSAVSHAASSVFDNAMATADLPNETVQEHSPAPSVVIPAITPFAHRLNDEATPKADVQSSAPLPSTTQVILPRPMDSSNVSPFRTNFSTKQREKSADSKPPSATNSEFQQPKAESQSVAPTIRVSIGRIVVRAKRQSVDTPPTSSRRPKSSLADYLAKSGRSG